VIDNFNAVLGSRLRVARQQRGWSLGEVESFTAGEFKASVVGAYERGERAISVQRFVHLADVYRVDPASLLPPASAQHDIEIDLDRLTSDNDSDLVERYLAAIRWLRRDGNPQEVRDGDKAVIASLMGSIVERAPSD
jgi:transcriptional regulator with XRE-family HTH domain